jgi:hypothetical protein
VRQVTGQVVSRLVAAVLAVFLATLPAAGKDSPVGVVELFTSQGCSSCPAADRILPDLARAGEVLALGYHVDYWDYRGWRDTLASPDYSRRQHLYARSLATRGVYTPQAVINGQKHVNGGDRAAIDRALAETAVPVEVTLRQKGDSVVISAGDGDPGGEEVHLILVFFDSQAEVQIERGANSGRTITYANVVTGLQTAGMWHGEAVEIELPRNALLRNASGGCAVLLQAVSAEGLPGRILGATVMFNPWTASH